MSITSEWYDTIIKMCKVMESLGWNYTEADPVSDEDIAAFEEENSCTIPEEYKEWLRLTGELIIDECDFGLYMPNDIFEHEDGFMAIPIGNVAAREYFINADSGKMFVYDDLAQDTKEFDSIDDLFTDMYARIEMYADDDFDEEWQEAYDEMFPAG